jgi:hypothetical protein
VKYFFDNCISYRYARMLAALEEFEVVALRDKFPHDIDDVELFQALKGSGFVFVTCDDRQKTREGEAKALRESGLTALWLGRFWSKKTFWDQARWIINRWPLIEGYVKGVAQGTCAQVKENGKSMPFNLGS